MDAATVFRIMSLIPDRSAWAPSGCAFIPEGKSERVVLLAQLMHWLSPLEALSGENQQLLGVRTGGGRAADAEEAELAEEMDEQPLHSPGTGTQIAV